MFAELIARLGSALTAADIPYMIIGGQAVLVHGEPRLTKDIDVTVGVGPERLDDLLALVGKLGLEPLVDPAEFVPATFVLPSADPATGIRVDMILSHSPYEQIAIARVVFRTVGGEAVAFASVEDLLIHKIVSGRPRDLEDVRVVLIKNPGVQHDYVERWLRDFGDALSEPLLDRYRTVLRSSQP
ncbi:MAG: nucleotidyl transferase AbiEii/AbiGii toxin family protein [Candidatus Eisenbacteria bacterium]|nr:nucleotidyl transferase AbiEii/AbiGii toxin family protein [Candidatus Eisenbacteria bacterium]